MEAFSLENHQNAWKGGDSIATPIETIYCKQHYSAKKNESVETPGSSIIQENLGHFSDAVVQVSSSACTCPSSLIEEYCLASHNPALFKNEGERLTLLQHGKNHPFQLSYFCEKRVSCHTTSRTASCSHLVPGLTISLSSTETSKSQTNAVPASNRASPIMPWHAFFRRKTSSTSSSPLSTFSPTPSSVKASPFLYSSAQEHSFQKSNHAVRIQSIEITRASGTDKNRLSHPESSSLGIRTPVGNDSHHSKSKDNRKSENACPHPRDNTADLPESSNNVLNCGQSIEISRTNEHNISIFSPTQRDTVKEDYALCILPSQHISLSNFSCASLTNSISSLIDSESDSVIALPVSDVHSTLENGTEDGRKGIKPTNANAVLRREKLDVPVRLRSSEIGNGKSYPHHMRPEKKCSTRGSQSVDKKVKVSSKFFFFRSARKKKTARKAHEATQVVETEDNQERDLQLFLSLANGRAPPLLHSPSDLEHRRSNPQRTRPAIFHSFPFRCFCRRRSSTPQWCSIPPPQPPQPLYHVSISDVWHPSRKNEEEMDLPSDPFLSYTSLLPCLGSPEYERSSLGPSSALVLPLHTEVRTVEGWKQVLECWCMEYTSRLALFRWWFTIFHQLCLVEYVDRSICVEESFACPFSPLLVQGEALPLPTFRWPECLVDLTYTWAGECYERVLELAQPSHPFPASVKKQKNVPERRSSLTSQMTSEDVETLKKEAPQEGKEPRVRVSLSEQCMKFFHRYLLYNPSFLVWWQQGKENKTTHRNSLAHAPCSEKGGKRQVMAKDEDDGGRRVNTHSEHPSPSKERPSFHLEGDRLRLWSNENEGKRRFLSPFSSFSHLSTRKDHSTDEEHVEDHDTRVHRTSASSLEQRSASGSRGPPLSSAGSHDQPFLVLEVVKSAFSTGEENALGSSLSTCATLAPHVGEKIVLPGSLLSSKAVDSVEKLRRGDAVRDSCTEEQDAALAVPNEGRRKEHHESPSALPYKPSPFDVENKEKMPCSFPLSPLSVQAMWASCQFIFTNTMLHACVHDSLLDWNEYMDRTAAAASPLGTPFCRSAAEPSSPSLPALLTLPTPEWTSCSRGEANLYAERFSITAVQSAGVRSTIRKDGSTEETAVQDSPHGAESGRYAMDSLPSTEEMGKKKTEWRAVSRGDHTCIERMQPGEWIALKMALWASFTNSNAITTTEVATPDPFIDFFSNEMSMPFPKNRGPEGRTHDALYRVECLETISRNTLLHLFQFLWSTLTTIPQAYYWVEEGGYEHWAMQNVAPVLHEVQGWWEEEWKKSLSPNSLPPVQEDVKKPAPAAVEGLSSPLVLREGSMRNGCYNPPLVPSSFFSCVCANACEKATPCTTTAFKAIQPKRSAATALRRSSLLLPRVAPLPKGICDSEAEQRTCLTGQEGLGVGLDSAEVPSHQPQDLLEMERRPFRSGVDSSVNSLNISLMTPCVSAEDHSSSAFLSSFSFSPMVFPYMEELAFSPTISTVGRPFTLPEESSTTLLSPNEFLFPGHQVKRVSEATDSISSPLFPINRTVSSRTPCRHHASQEVCMSPLFSHSSSRGCVLDKTTSGRAIFHLALNYLGSPLSPSHLKRVQDAAQHRNLPLPPSGYVFPQSFNSLSPLTRSPLQRPAEERKKVHASKKRRDEQKDSSREGKPEKEEWRNTSVPFSCVSVEGVVSPSSHPKPRHLVLPLGSLEWTKPHSKVLESFHLEKGSPLCLERDNVPENMLDPSLSYKSVNPLGSPL